VKIIHALPLFLFNQARHSVRIKLFDHSSDKPDGMIKVIPADNTCMATLRFIQVGGSLTTTEALKIRQGRSFQAILGAPRKGAELS
jgi:hypothetical protein